MELASGDTTRLGLINIQIVSIIPSAVLHRFPDDWNGLSYYHVFFLPHVKETDRDRIILSAPCCCSPPTLTSS